MKLLIILEFNLSFLPRKISWLTGHIKSAYSYTSKSFNVVILGQSHHQIIRSQQSSSYSLYCGSFRKIVREDKLICSYNSRRRSRDLEGVDNWFCYVTIYSIRRRIPISGWIIRPCSKASCDCKCGEDSGRVIALENVDGELSSDVGDCLSGRVNRIRRSIRQRFESCCSGINTRYCVVRSNYHSYY